MVDGYDARWLDRFGGLLDIPTGAHFGGVS
jgi:hypothetical protein